MKKLICQKWQKIDEKGIIANSHSLHLTEKSRVLYIHRNLKKMESNGLVNLENNYFCEVEDDVYDQVLNNQTKHGLMMESDPPNDSAVQSLIDQFVAQLTRHYKR